MTARHPLPTIVFAGGGTGGHIFPALAIAEELDRLAGAPVPRAFLISERPLDQQILSAAGERAVPTRAQPAVLRPAAFARFLASWGPSVRTARALLREAKARGPVRLVAMGGFVAPPPVQAARAERVPVLLVNLDATPGLANRWIARRTRAVRAALPVPGRDWPVVGPIVRRALTEPRDPADARRALGLDPALRTLLITGGSQGAQSVGLFVLAAAEADPARFAGWQVLHQAGVRTGDAFTDQCAQRWGALGIRASVAPFLTDMPSAWAAADLHVGRCGAGTVAECWATRTPSLFFPYPWHKDQHQRLNAEPLAAAGGAVLATDRIDAVTNTAAHAATLGELLTAPDRLKDMRDALARLGPPDGARRIAQELLDPAFSDQKS